MDVLKVHKEMFTSPKMMYIRTCSHYEQLFLRCVCVGDVFACPFAKCNNVNIEFHKINRFLFISVLVKCTWSV